jgi:flagellar L-ring protein precursor FlgH
MKRIFVLLTLLTAASAAFSQPLFAQNNSLMRAAPSQPMQLASGAITPVDPRAFSWTYVPPPPPREIKVNDLVQVRVEVKSRASADGQLQRRKTSVFDATLKDWIRFSGFGIKPASNDEPRIQGNLNDNTRALSDLDTTELLQFDITATVVDVKPNGNVVLEASSDVQVDEEIWNYTLTGTVSPIHIGNNNIIESKHIANLRIERSTRGMVRDGYRRGWLTKLYNTFTPF